MQKLPGSTGTSPSPIVGLTTTVLPGPGSVLLIILTAEGALYLYTCQQGDTKPPEASQWLLEDPANSNLGSCWGRTGPVAGSSTQLPAGDGLPLCIHVARGCSSALGVSR